MVDVQGAWIQAGFRCRSCRDCGLAAGIPSSRNREAMSCLPVQSAFAGTTNFVVNQSFPGCWQLMRVRDPVRRDHAALNRAWQTQGLIADRRAPVGRMRV